MLGRRGLLVHDVDVPHVRRDSQITGILCIARKGTKCSYTSVYRDMVVCEQP